MKRKIIDILLLRTMFSRLMASFLLIILTVSFFYLYAYKTYLKIIETEITVNMDERFSKVVAKNEQIFEQIKNAMVQLHDEEAFFPLINGQSTNMYEKRVLFEKLNERVYKKNYSGFMDYVKAMYIMPKQPDKIIVEALGTYDSELFYIKFFNSRNYTKEFWLEEMNKDFIFKIYPADTFNDYSRIGSSSSFLMPFAFKKGNNSNFLIISLVRIEDLIRSIDKSFVDYYYIYNNYGDMIYPSVSGSKLLIPEGAFADGKNFVKTIQGYLFMRTSNFSGLTYYRLVPDAQLRQQLAKVNVIFRLVLVFSLLFSVLLSFLIVVKFNNPVKQIAEVITQSKNFKQEHYAVNHEKTAKVYKPVSAIKSMKMKEVSSHKNIFDLNYIRDNVRLIVEQNADYARDIKTRNSNLEAFLYQAKMKDIYIQADEIKENLSVTQSYILIYFKLHFKPEFLKKMPHEQETSKITFLFKELIQLYVKEHFKSSITFQMENKKIVSIINVEKNEKNIEILINDIIRQLENDKEFVYFTIAISKTYDNVSYLKEAYNSMFEIAKHRKLVAETQVLTEDSINKNSNRFYFPLEQMEEFTGFLRNSQKQESLRMVSEILDYNMKKDVNSFYIKLLCIEIVNCSIKLLTRMYYDIPKEINTSRVYYLLEECDTIKEYESICHEFIENVIDYIARNKKKNDYIIDFIINYVEEHYMEDIYLDLLAEKLNLSAAYISSYFKARLNINLNDYINNYRIKKSMELIENTQMKVKDIAMKVGFANGNTFIRLFKKYSGFTPKEYRRNSGLLDEPFRADS